MVQFLMDTLQATGAQFKNAFAFNNLPLMLGTLVGSTIALGTLGAIKNTSTDTLKAVLRGDLTWAGKEVAQFGSDWADQQVAILKALKKKRKYNGGKRMKKGGN